MTYAMRADAHDKLSGAAAIMHVKSYVPEAALFTVEKEATAGKNKTRSAKEPLRG